jgi:hypothetical protein
MSDLKTRVVNIKNGEPFDVYIGRQRSPKMSPTGRSLRRSIWANPYRGKGCIEKFERYLLEDAQQYLRDTLPAVKGKVLACYCAPPGGVTADDPVCCHGQVIARLADETS